MRSDACIDAVTEVGLFCCLLFRCRRSRRGSTCPAIRTLQALPRRSRQPAIYTLTGWRLETLRARAGGPAVADLASGAVFEIEGGEAVTAAPELARVTLNIATAHTDAVGSVHGWRHVYASHLDREGAL
jgi:hypothetical protein